ncbi:hypothetical protein [Streptomyces termitum]|uniref:hypothetical protein n=1 Tax=Streptomyces termitum TaxID=67368 RepID=UPI003793D3CE
MANECPWGPTRYLSGGERLLRGKDTASAAGAGRAADWTGLDSDVFQGTLSRVAGWRGSSSRFPLGAHWFDRREVANWETAPYWDEEAGAPSWSLPPTPSELALCLCHADARVRAAALDAAGAAAPPALLLLRCADGDEGVRERARAVLTEVLAATRDEEARSLAALALLVGTRRHGRWGREAVLARTGVPEDAVRELLAYEGWAGPAARRAGTRAGAEAGILDEDALYAIALASGDAAGRVEAVRAALGVRRDATAARNRFLAFLEECGDSQSRVRALRCAVAEGLLSPGDLAGLALGHRDRRVRRLAARLLPALPGADAVLERLEGAADSVVRGAAVARLRAAGRTGGLVPYLADPSPWVRGIARRGLREAGADPHARLRTWCADPAAVTPPAVSGLAEEGGPGDAPLLHELTRHPDGAVRARALGGLRRLGALADAALPPYADDPDPRVGAVVLRALRDDPVALRGLLGHPHARVRAAALVLLARRHRLGWDEALPHLGDPAAEVARGAREALRRAAHEVPDERLIALTTPGEPPARRTLAMELLARRHDPGVLLNALRLLDDPLPGVRAAARDRSRQLKWDRRAAEGPRGDEIRALAEAHAERIDHWWAEHQRRLRAARAAENPGRTRTGGV